MFESMAVGSLLIALATNPMPPGFVKVDPAVCRPQAGFELPPNMVCLKKVEETKT